MIPRRVLTPEFIAVWQRYEAANAAAARQYEQMPVSYNHAGPRRRCARCNAYTRAVGPCRACRKGEVS
jgi:hypothetical protein